MNNENKTYCSYLWDSLCIRPDERLIPCCVYKDYPHSAYIDQSSTGIFNALNSDVFKDLRNKALSGQEIKGCQTCYLREKNTHHSKRLGANKMAQQIFSSQESSLENIVHLEVFLSNKCNLKCSMCSPELSLPLAQDYIKLGIVGDKYKKPIENDYSEQITHLKNLKYLKFVGGEPLLSDAHDKLICTLPETQAKNIWLEYATNCTVFPKENILEHWSKFAGVKIILSIDGHQTTNEYIRYPSEWSHVDSIAKKFCQYAQKNPRVKLGINSVVSIYNILSLTPFLSWVEETKGDIIGPQDHTLNPIRHPSFLSIQHLPNEMKEKISDLYPHNKQTAALHGVLKQLADPTEYERLKDFTQSFDQTRNISYKNYLYGLEDLLEKITTTNRDWHQSII